MNGSYPYVAEVGKDFFPATTFPKAQFLSLDSGHKNGPPKFEDFLYFGLIPNYPKI